jgi:hypothetical protein
MRASTPERTASWLIFIEDLPEQVRGKQLSDTLLGVIPPKPKVSIP